MTRTPPPLPLAAYAFAAVAVAVVAWLTSALLPWLGLASAALLFLLPVLFTAVSGRTGPALFAAIGGAAAYNFFLLPPRFTFLIHAPENLVSVVVLIAVAIVTSRLATRLRAREGEALASAERSRQQAELAALLAGAEPKNALDAAVTWLEQRFGPVRHIDLDGLPAGEPGFSALDVSAAAWAMHNADLTGHGSRIMAAADWTFLPVSPRGHQDSPLLAVARPADGSTRSDHELSALRDFAALVGQASDRAALDQERQTRERLEQGDRMRQSLLAALAHDFRTPLTVITGQLEALTGRGMEAGEALAAARRLDRSMDDLIGAARLDQGALMPQIETVDVIDVVAKALDGLRMPARLTITRTIAADLPFVAADPVLLTHIIANLVDNGLRHARGVIDLAADVSNGTVRLSISDDGTGVPDADRDHVFDRFVRIEGSDRTDGSGLGLAIVRGFAEAMAMHVSLSAAPSGGACFTLAMPVAGHAATDAMG